MVWFSEIKAHIKVQLKESIIVIRAVRVVRAMARINTKVIADMVARLQ